MIIKATDALTSIKAAYLKAYFTDDSRPYTHGSLYCWEGAMKPLQAVEHSYYHEVELKPSEALKKALALGSTVHLDIFTDDNFELYILNEGFDVLMANKDFFLNNFGEVYKGQWRQVLSQEDTDLLYISVMKQEKI
jgi:hypothetical protein